MGSNVVTPDNLQAAVDALQSALGKVQAIGAEHPGDQLFYDAENSLSATILNLMTRQANSKPPPIDRETAYFFDLDY